MTEQRVTGVPGLGEGQFRRIAERGFGDGQNSYPHAMAWFDGHLYVGTTRCVLALTHHRNASAKTWRTWPVRPATTHPYDDFDIRSEIWRYDPVADRWRMMYRSPMVQTPEGKSVPVFFGVRKMLVYRRPGEDRPHLYMHSGSPRGGPGPLLLRTGDGSHYEQYKIDLFQPDEFASYRPLVLFKDRLFTAPTGRTGGGAVAGAALVLETRDPIDERWKQVNEESFGNPHNEGVFEIEAFNGHLYAATLNSDGFELWKTEAEGKVPYDWKRVLTRGAGRGPLNQGVASMCEFQGALYIGTGISQGGYDQRTGIGPAAAEVLRVHPDDSWDLLVGEPRITEDGWKVPASGRGPGFDKPFNTYLWCMAVHEGWLYAGTFSAGSLLPYIPRERWPSEKREMLDAEREHLAIEHLGGFDLWRTRCGSHWIPVTRNGFGNRYNYGVRTMVSTQHGMFVGVTNPFGPEVAVQRPTGWHYEENPRGGLEVWLGSRDYDPVTSKAPQPAPIEGAAQPAPRIRSGRTSIGRPEAADPLGGFFGESGFRSFGSWGHGIESAEAACRNLVDDLLAHVPADADRILDLGSGSGATTMYTVERRPRAEVAALTFDRTQRDALRVRCGDREVDARPRPPSRFADSSFDAVVNVETLSLQSHAVDWLDDVLRVLRPGGVFVCAAVLSEGPRSGWRRGSRRAGRAPTSAEAFEALLSASGFADVRVVDITSSSWMAFRTRFDRYLWERTVHYEINSQMAAELKTRLYGPFEPFSACVQAVARKPRGETA